MIAGPQDTSPTGKTYRITHVSDFCKVPPMRLADCLGEFAAMLFTMHKDRLNLPPGQGVMLRTFEWTDDGVADNVTMHYDKLTGWRLLLASAELIVPILVMLGFAVLAGMRMR